MSGLLLVLALGAIAVMAVGNRVGVQPGLAILVAAAGVSFIPGLPRWELEPELILGVVVPPLLYAAALEFSFFSFLRNLRSIVGLGVGLVVATAFLAGHVAAWLLPGLGVGAAMVLGAIVGPPDTVTIAAHGRALGLTRRVNALLTGESLVNDAAALTMFSVFVAAVAGTETFIDGPVVLFLYSVGVGVLVGVLLGVVATTVRSWLRDPTLETATGLVLPFAAFFVAEHIHASGVLAVVMAGFAVSMNSVYRGGGRPAGPPGDGDPARPRLRRGFARRVDFRTRITEAAIWPVVNTLLEAFVFAYTGLQLRFVIEELLDSDEPLGRTLLAGAVILLAVVGIRIAYIMVLFRNSTRREARRERRTAVLRLRRPQWRGRVPNRPLSRSESFLLSWAGMRGIVTLGAAGGIPFALDTGEPFPHRSTIQFLAYFVVIGTLVLQGPTLPLFARWLRPDTTAEDAGAVRDLAAARALADATAPRGYDAQRTAITHAVVERRFDDEAARLVLADIDQQEAAAASRTRTTRPAE